MAFQREPIIVQSSERWAVGFISSESHDEWKGMDAGTYQKFNKKFEMLAIAGRLPKHMIKQIKGSSIFEIELKGQSGNERAYCYLNDHTWLITHFGQTDHSKYKTQKAAEQANAIRAAYEEFLDEPEKTTSEENDGSH